MSNRSDLHLLSNIEVIERGPSRIVICNETHAAPDELRPVAHWAKAWGLEEKGLRRALRAAGLGTVKIGRTECARRSDILSIAAKEPPKPARVEPASYEALVAVARGSR